MVDTARGAPAGPAVAAPLRGAASCNRSYLEYLSSLDDFSAGIRALDRLTQPRLVNGRTVKGLNFFSHPERTLLSVLQRPAYNIAGLRRADLLPFLPNALPPPSPDTSPGCASSTSSNASPAPIATTSPAPAAPPSRLAVASLNTPSFLPSPDKSAHMLQTLSS